MKVVVVKCDENGNIDMVDFVDKIEKYKDYFFSIMIIYFLMYGVYE